MKNKNFLIIALLSIAVLALVFALALHESSAQPPIDANNSVSRRYLDPSEGNNFQELHQVNFLSLSTLAESVYWKALAIIMIIQSFFIIKRLRIKNAFLITGWLLSSLITVFIALFSVDIRRTVVTGLNPSLFYVIVAFLVFQLMGWIYLNIRLFQNFAHKNSQH